MVEKKYVLTFKSPLGVEFTLGTDDIEEIFTQSWFSGAKPHSARQRSDAEQQLFEAEGIIAELNLEVKTLRRQVMEMGQFIKERVEPSGNAPQAIAPPPRPSTFLEVTPDRMTEEMWKSLDDAQKRQYMERYGK